VTHGRHVHRPSTPNSTCVCSHATTDPASRCRSRLYAYNGTDINSAQAAPKITERELHKGRTTNIKLYDYAAYQPRSSSTTSTERDINVNHTPGRCGTLLHRLPRQQDIDTIIVTRDAFKRHTTSCLLPLHRRYFIARSTSSVVFIDISSTHFHRHMTLSTRMDNHPLTVLLQGDTTRHRRRRRPRPTDKTASTNMHHHL
jgi:hypothetical protein